MEPATWISLVTNVGFPIAMVIYFIISNKRRDEVNAKVQKERDDQALQRERDLKEEAFDREKLLRAEAIEREKRLGDRIDKLEDGHREEMMAVIKLQTETQAKSIAAQDRLSDALQRQSHNLDKLVGVLEKRPCLEPHGAGVLPRSDDPSGQTTRTHRAR